MYTQLNWAHKKNQAFESELRQAQAHHQQQRQQHLFPTHDSSAPDEAPLHDPVRRHGGHRLRADLLGPIW